MGKKSKRGQAGGGGGFPAPEQPPPVEVASIDQARREELRLKLRAKMRNGGNVSKQEAAKQLMDDPASALLRMGIDDPKIIQAAPGMVKSIASRVRSGKAVTGEKGLQETLTDVCRAIANDETVPGAADESSDDEEAPPPHV